MTCNASHINKVIRCLNIKDHKGYLYFPEVMWALFHSLIGVNDPAVVKSSKVKNMMKALKKTYKDLTLIHPHAMTGMKFWENEFTAIQYLSAKKIIHAWKLRKLKNKKDIFSLVKNIKVRGKQSINSLTSPRTQEPNND